MRCLNVCNYNVRSISGKNPQALPTLLAEISNFKWDIVGMSETKIMENAAYRVDDDHYLFNSGNECLRRNGVGFLVNKDYIDKFVCFNNYSDRVCSIKLNVDKIKVVCIHAYFPTTIGEDDELDQVYSDVKKL